MTDRSKLLAEYAEMIARMSLSSEVQPVEDDTGTLDALICRARALTSALPATGEVGRG